MKEHIPQKTLKKLENRTVPALSSASKKGNFIVGIFFFIWGLAILAMTRGSFNLPAMLMAAAILVISVVLFSNASEKQDYFTSLYDPFKKARKRLKMTVFVILFFSFFLPPFLLVFPMNPFYLIPLIFVVLSIYVSIRLIKTYFQLSANGRIYGKSKIQLLEQPLVLGGNLRLRFENNSRPLIGKRLKASLRNISEIMEEARVSSEDSRSIHLYQRYEKVIDFVMEEPQKMLSFQIPTTGTVPTNIVGLEPDYWELEIRESEGLYFSRFLLEIK